MVRCPACQAAINVPRLEDIAPKSEEAKTPQAKVPPKTETPAPPSPEAEPQSAVPEPPPASASVETAPAPEVPAPVDDDEGFVLRSPETDFEDMDLTPMVDVTFLLLIFFMITASFSLQKTIQVPPPDPDEKGAAQAMTMQELEKDAIIVEIDEKNVIIVDDEPLSDPDDLVDKLRDKMRSEQKTELVLEADDRTLHGYVVMVVDAANEVQMQRIRLVTRSEN